MAFRNYINLGSIGGLVGLLMAQPACVDDGDVRGSGEVIDRSTQALLAGELESVNGTYGAACTDRGVDEDWSLLIAGGAVPDHEVLTVVLNDTACVLTMTAVHTTTGIIAAVPPIALTSAFQPAASSFDVPIEFYANARVDDPAFSDDFLLTILYSDDETLASGVNTAGFTVVASTSLGSAVLAPDYVLDLETLIVLTDAGDFVQTATGTAGLSNDPATGQDGETYVVVDASGLNTYGEIDEAYLAGVPAAFTTTIPASAFTLVGEDLTVPDIRTLILAHTVSGVSSYQVFEITFQAATP